MNKTPYEAWLVNGSLETALRNVSISAEKYARRTSYTIGQNLYVLQSESMYFHSETDPDVIDAITSAYRNKTRVRVFLGNTATGQAWSDENDVLGTIGRSSGECKTPLLIANARSCGGGAILTQCIVAIVDTKTGRFLYRHPTFNPGVWTIAPSSEPGYLESAFCNGVLQANFKKPGQALRYCGFMSGLRFSK